MKKIIISSLLALSASVYAIEPVALLQKNDQALKPLLLEYQKTPTPEKAALLRTLGAGLFDVSEMSKRALPTGQWDKLKADQKKKFADDFKTIMEYGFLEKMKNEAAFDSVVYKPAQKTADGQSVEGAVWSKGTSTKVLYKFKTAKELKAYDLETEGLSTLKAYRDQFKKKFDKTGMAGVIEMVKKNADKKRAQTK